MTKKSQSRKQKKNQPRSKLSLAKEEPQLRLDLACGQTPAEGYEGVDLNAPNAKHKVDLFKFPFPWADGSVDEINCSHFIEHIPLRDVVESDLHEDCPIELMQDFLGKDMLFAFMDECWRILKPGSHMHIQVPAATSTRAFQDPTHRRFIVQDTFYYFAKAWRTAQKLDHYRVKCDFGFNAIPTVLTEETIYAPEVQQRRFKDCWNVVLDWKVDLQANK